MSAGLEINGEILWSTNASIGAYVDGLASVAARTLGPNDPVAVFLREQCESYFPGNVVVLDEHIVDDSLRQRFAEILEPTKEQLLRDGGFTELGREWVVTFTARLQQKLAAPVWAKDRAGAQFLARHEPSPHPYLEAVRIAVAQGRCEVEPCSGTVACDEALAIYRIRARHLAQFSTPHATELRQNVGRFCARLAASRGQRFRWWSFRCTDGTHYAFAEHSESQELLGALRTVSKLGVPPEEWERLWGGGGEL